MRIVKTDHTGRICIISTQASRLIWVFVWPKPKSLIRHTAAQITDYMPSLLLFSQYTWAPPWENLSWTFSTKSDKNRAVLPQKIVRGLKFWIRKKRDVTIYVAKTKPLISCTVTAHLICAFVSAYAKIRFSNEAAQMTLYIILLLNLKVPTTTIVCQTL